MKISIITAVYNRCDTVGQCVLSLQAQTHANVEHVIIDAGSKDGTLSVLEDLSNKNMQLVSEPDEGIYDALNKGIARANGDVIGLLHSDDIFASPNVLSQVADIFASDPAAMAVYGDLDYVFANDTSRIIRHWKAGDFSPSRLARGWMPPHPTLFLRRDVFDRWGTYDTRYRIAADYDAILRWFSKREFEARYIPQVLVKMRVGGESNRSLGRILRKSSEDYRAIRSNGVGGLGTLAIKNVSKVQQFFRREPGLQDQQEH